jgi:transglutaminase-like putative cysteine protease
LDGVHAEFVSPPSIPMYIAALIVTCCGVYAATEYLADEPFAKLVFGLTILGFIVSYVSRQQNVSPRHIELPALIICGCVFLSGVFSDQPFLAPVSIGEDRHRSLAVLLTWLVVFRSFTLINDGALLFCCVPTIALIGLISTNMVESSPLWAFIVFVAAASFMLVHENFLRTRHAATYRRPVRARSSMIGPQLQAAGVCVAASLVLANLLVVPLRGLLNQVQVSAGIPTIRSNSSNTTTVSPASFSESQDVRIGNGPVSQSDQVVMRVQAELEEPYWRGATFDKYLGHAWKNQLATRPLERTTSSESAANGALVAPRYEFTLPVTPFTAVSGPHHRARQVVQLQGAPFQSLYGASEPRHLRMSQSQAFADETGSIQLDTFAFNVEYEIESDVSDATPADMMKSSGEYPREITSLYLQLPSDRAMVNRWKEAAMEATAGKKSSYEKARAITEWVGNQCKYNLKAEAVPSDEDVVDTFLFKQKQGYCDSFASAVAMLCRSIGIPARVASGFLTGEQDSVKKEFVVRERDKHQWTEVYLNGIGWVKFDATGLAENITPEEGTKASRDRSVFAFLFGRGWLPPLAMAVFVCMLLYVLKVEVWDRFRRSSRTRNLLNLPAENLEIVLAYDSVCDLLAGYGLRRKPWETAAEFRERAHNSLSAWPDAQSQFDRLTVTMIVARYSGERSSSDDLRTAQDAVTGIKAGLRSARKRDVHAAIAALEGAA